MRSTKASAAIERLNRRSEQANYSMAMTSNGLFSLIQTNIPDNTREKITSSAEENQEAIKSRLCEPMLMDEFVLFVNAYGPQMTKRVSKLDVAFSAQLAKSKIKLTTSSK